MPGSLARISTDGYVLVFQSAKSRMHCAVIDSDRPLAERADTSFRSAYVKRYAKYREVERAKTAAVRTIVQYQQLSGSYAQGDNVEILGAGSRRRKWGCCAGQEFAEEMPRVKALVHER
jgi:hypothetical protein